MYEVENLKVFFILFSHWLQWTMFYSHSTNHERIPPRFEAFPKEIDFTLNTMGVFLWTENYCPDEEKYRIVSICGPSYFWTMKYIDILKINISLI